MDCIRIPPTNTIIINLFYLLYNTIWLAVLIALGDVSPCKALLVTIPVECKIWRHLQPIVRTINE